LSESVAAADAVDPVGVHYRRTGHQDYTARYIDGRGLRLDCTSCDTRIGISQPAKAPEAAAAVKQAGSGNQPGDTPDYPRRTRVNPDRWPYV
jgi:hypothetical protein